MKKPELSDFGLNEKLLEENRTQHKRYDQLLDEQLKKRKNIKKGILVVSLIASVVAFIIVATTGFDKDVFGYVMGCFLFWDVTYGVYFFQTSDESRSDISYNKTKEIKSSSIDDKLEQAINSYNDALRQYENSFRISEQSIVKVETLLPSFFGDSQGLTPHWVVFSNIHLANPRSYPDIDVNISDRENFEKRYFSLIEQQKNTVPKLKKSIPIPHEEKVEFFYPCSDMYLALKGKKPRDVIELSVGVRYRVLQVLKLE